MRGVHSDGERGEIIRCEMEVGVEKFGNGIS